MSRVYNFSAGPSMLPESVLRKAAEEMLDYQGSGQSVMEMSHRSKTYQSIIDSCSSLLREVMDIPEDYEIHMCYTDVVPAHGSGINPKGSDSAGKSPAPTCERGNNL